MVSPGRWPHRQLDRRRSRRRRTSWPGRQAQRPLPEARVEMTSAPFPAPLVFVRKGKAGALVLAQMKRVGGGPSNDKTTTRETRRDGRQRDAQLAGCRVCARPAGHRKEDGRREPGAAQGCCPAPDMPPGSLARRRGEPGEGRELPRPPEETFSRPAPQTGDTVSPTHLA